MEDNDNGFARKFWFKPLHAKGYNRGRFISLCGSKMEQLFKVRGLY